MPKPPAVVKVAIRLPSPLFRAVDRLRRTTGERRSAVVRRSLERLVAEGEEAGMVRAYVAGYRAHPEGKPETDAAMATATESLAEGPWE